MKKGIDKTVAGLVEELEKKSRPVKGSGDIKGTLFMILMEMKFNLYNYTSDSYS